jgi:PAS domain S-box-containing protein
LVDDDRLQLKLSALRLRQAGFTVTTASTAREALAFAIGDPPDAILSDVIMGDTDGFELCRQLREHVLLENVPILLLSAHYRDVKGRQLATHVGASALVARTPEFDAELRALHDALGQERTSEQRLVSRDVTQAHLRTNIAEMAKLAGAAKVAGDRYQVLFEHANDAISVLSRAGSILEANQRWSVLLGVPAANIVGKHLLELASPARDVNRAELDTAIARGAGRVDGVAIERPDGSRVYLDFSISVVETSAETLVLAIGRDVTEHLPADPS